MWIIAVIRINIADSKVHEANMGPIWGRQNPSGPHAGPMNFAIWDIFEANGIAIWAPFLLWVALFALKAAEIQVLPWATSTDEWIRITSSHKVYPMKYAHGFVVIHWFIGIVVIALIIVIVIIVMLLLLLLLTLSLSLSLLLLLLSSSSSSLSLSSLSVPNYSFINILHDCPTSTGALLWVK